MLELKEGDIKLIGKIEYILFQNSENYYTVSKFRIMDENEKVITVTGYFPNVEEDIIYHISGHYTEHPRYGIQFVMTSFERPLPNEEEAVVRYLSGAQFPGIGKKTATKIFEALGSSCLDLIKEDSTVLNHVNGLSKSQISIIVEGIQNQEPGMEELIQFLNVHGIGMRNLVRLNRVYGSTALSKLKENPYRVIEECDGFGFETADKIAFSLGFQEDDERRLYALLIYKCMDLCMQSGDTSADIESLTNHFRKATKKIHYDFEALLEEAVLKGQLVKEENRVYPITQHIAEEFCSRFLVEFPYVLTEDFNLEKLYEHLDHLQKNNCIQYDEAQILAIETFFVHPFSVITGGPGTGKTTVIKAFIDLHRVMAPNAKIVCAAPTGRAAKRLSEVTGTTATTLHSLLKWDLETNTFGKNDDDPIVADLLIVDEFSMVDNWLFYHLLKASKQIRKICIIGDENQLPSVSPGDVLRDLIACDVFPFVRLNNIHRQKTGSDIIELAHQVRNGVVDFTTFDHEVKFFDCNPSDTRRLVIQIVQNALDKGFDINDIQVLSPSYNGADGIDVLNNALQDCFNSHSKVKKEIKSGYHCFRENDKVIQLKNQPDDNVYNGDIGIIEEILEAHESERNVRTVIVRFDDDFVEYTPETLGNIRPAYCISVHKSQGSEYPIVIMPISSSHSYLLQKRLIYTAITRAKKALILLGERDALQRFIKREEVHIRFTKLKEKVIEKRDFLESFM